MAGDESGLVTQGPKFFTDGTDQCGAITARQVRTIDRTPEQYITNDCLLVLSARKYHMIRGVTGTMMYGLNFVAKAHRVTIPQPMGWYKGTLTFDSKPCGRLAQAVDQN